MRARQMRIRQAEQIALAALLFAACTALVVALCTSPSHAQNPSTSLTVPAPTEQPVSPINPGTLPGTTGTTIGTNPITGQPCAGSGSSADEGLAGESSESDTTPGVSSSSSSIYSPDVANGTTLGAC